MVKKRICVIGLGYIGLPTACVLADKGYDVIGVDIDKKVVDKIQSANITNFTHISHKTLQQSSVIFCEQCGLEPGLQDLLIRVNKLKNFKVSINIDSADIYIIAVPTPLNKNNQPDLSYVNSAIKNVKSYLKPNSLIIIESTCPIGTTNLIAEDLQKTHSQIKVAYCPERVLPGNIIHELIHNDRVVGGVDQESTMQAIDFYRSFVNGNILPTNAKTAEAVKLAENSYRDLNIAFANELSMIADYVELNVEEIIKLANKHPRVQILKPGIGVGGHCILVDPWFLISSAPGYAGLIKKAREINTKKTQWIIQKIKNAIKKNNSNTIACLGLTYKPNTSDIRESPALSIVESLEKHVEVLRVDPYVLNTMDIKEALKRADIIVGLVAHDVFKDIPPKMLADKMILDFVGMLKPKLCEKPLAENEQNE